MFKMKLDIQTLPRSEWPDHPTDGTEYAQITLSICNQNAECVVAPFSVKWDVQPIIQWFSENREYLFADKFPVSLAQRLSAFYEADEVTDELIEAIYSYRTRHGLRFALRGVDVPDVYIGRTEIGIEISATAKSGGWSYPIDLEAFYTEHADLFSHYAK